MQKGVPFTERDVSREPGAAQEMVARTGQQGVPVIIVGREVVVGFNRPRLEQLLTLAQARGSATGQRPSLGLKIADAGSMTGKVPNLPTTSGAYVGGVTPGSPAARAGLAPGDIIVAIQGMMVTSAADLQRLVAQAGRQFSLTFQRADKTYQAYIVMSNA